MQHFAGFLVIAVPQQREAEPGAHLQGLTGKHVRLRFMPAPASSEASSAARSMFPLNGWITEG